MSSWSCRGTAGTTTSSRASTPARGSRGRPCSGGGIPRAVPRTPEEEFAVQRAWIERALALGLDYFSPVYHPHSVFRTGPECRVVELLMRHVRHKGMATTTYGALYGTYSALRETVPGRNAWTWEMEQKTEKPNMG